MRGVARPSAGAVQTNPVARARALTRARKLVVYLVLSAILVFALFPFIWTLMIAVTDSGSVTTGHTVYDFPGSLFPRRVTFANFVNVFTTYPALSRALLNSIVISALTVIGTLLVSSLAAYPLARRRFAGQALVYGVIVATLVLPTETSFVVNMLTLAKLRQIPGIGDLIGLGSYLGVVLPTVSTAFGIFVMRQAFLMVPESLLEAARMDGASDMRIFARIMLPLSTPSLAALAIFTLVNTWNSYFWPSVSLIGAQDKLPLAVEMLKLKGAFNDNIFNTAAGAMIMMVPILLLFIFAQRFFMRGLDGAVK